MENKKKGEDKLKKHISNIVNPICNRVLQEKKSNSMTTVTPSIKLIWRPNNYRRKILVKERKIASNSAILTLLTHYSKWNMNKHTKLISIKYSDNITLQYGRQYLTAIWSQKIIKGKKQTYVIEVDNEKNFDKWLDTKKTEIRNKLDSALFSLAQRLDIRLYKEQPIWSRHEDFIKGEEYIDSLPVETIIYDSVFKKVYSVGIEAFGGENIEPVARIKTYIKNRMLEKWTPQIVQELNFLSSKFEIFTDKIMPSIDHLARHMESHAKFMNNAAGIMKGTNKVLKKLDTRLSQKKLGEFF